MQFYAPDIQKPGRKEEEKDGGRKMEGWKEGGREGKKKRRMKIFMHDFFASSVFFGVFLSLGAYFVGLCIRKKQVLHSFIRF